MNGRDVNATDRSIDLRVSRLRRRLEENPQHAKLIKTVYGAIAGLFNAQVTAVIKIAALIKLAYLDHFTDTYYTLHGKTTARTSEGQDRRELILDCTICSLSTVITVPR